MISTTKPMTLAPKISNLRMKFLLKAIKLQIYSKNMQVAAVGATMAALIHSFGKIFKKGNNDNALIVNI